MTTASMKGAALVTGATSAFGALYADRLIRRGHDLVLVARNGERLDALGERLKGENGRLVEVIPADLTKSLDIAEVERKLRSDTGITMLVNCAGVGDMGSLFAFNAGSLEQTITRNITALMRLTHAVLRPFERQGGGAIINLASILAIAPELQNGVFAGANAFVLAFSMSLKKELAGTNIHVQTVLPFASATDFAAIARTPLDELSASLAASASAIVDEAFSGFDRGEPITIPGLAETHDWETFEAARQHLILKLPPNIPAAKMGPV